MRRPLPLLALLPCSALLALRQPARPDALRGRVTTTAGAPVAGAEVLATRAPDRATRSARADSAGRWRIDWPDGTGDYLVHVAAPGFVARARRVTRDTTRDTTRGDPALVVDMALLRVGERVAAQPLAAVVTQAPRTARPERLSTRGDVGASEAWGTDPDLLPASRAGDLAAAAAQHPGVVATAGGISVLGLAPAQNAVTLNGLAFAGTQLPRDLAARVRVAASSYDPSVGWFSGARTNVRLAPGGLFAARVARATVEPPALQSGDPAARGLGQRAAVADLSLAGDGPVAGPLGRWFSYNAGLQATRRTAAQASLASADPALLLRAGVAPDSAARLLSLLGRAGVPAGAARAPDATTDHLVVLGRVDHAPYDWATLQPARATWGLTAYGDWSRQQALGLTATGTPAHGGRGERRVGMLEAELSRYVRGDALATARTAVGVDRATVAPALALPDGRVRVASDLPGRGADGLATLAFGGNGALRADARRWTWESAAELELYPPGHPAHRVKLAGDVRLDGFADAAFPDAAGTFAYNSLADLEAGRPAAFTRTLGASTRRGREWNAFLSAGDLWRAGQRLQLLYGLRVEGSAFAGAPPRNPAVERAFGARTDRLPRAAAVLPRAGFTLDLPGANGRPSGTLRGGVGAFRILLDPRLAAGPSVATGLPDGVTRLLCVGDAIPTPDWSAFARDAAAVPARCADGGTGAYRDGAPDVQLVDPRVRPPSSWRGNLAWSSHWRGVGYSLGGIYSRDRYQPGAVDLNFAGVPRFALADEGGRPVFVSPSGIVPATGAVSPAEGRRSAAFGRVTAATSTLRGVGRQATALLFPPLLELPGGALVAETIVGYTYSARREEQTGFAGTTFGAPSAAEWARGALDVRHRVVAQASVFPFGNRHGVGLVLGAQAQSGRPYTPLVAGDVNGDGLANDRAFVRAEDVAPLLAAAPPRARRCLARQLGRPAAPNGCEGPWSATLNANLILGRAPVPLLPRRANVTVGFANVLGGVDRLLHGPAGVRGWGTTPAPDPVLYATRGFDPATRRFRYEVNPRFGDPRAATLSAPFRVSIDVRLDVAPGQTRQQLARWLAPGRTRSGTRLGASELGRRLARNVPDPYAELLAQGDSLLLTADQASRVRAAQARWRARIDSTWAATARWLDTLPARYDDRAVVRRADAAIGDAWELTRLDVRERLAEILTPLQLSLLGGTARLLWTSPFRITDWRFVP